MTEQALKQLQEQLNCTICLDTYTDPKLLQCFHVYCRQCLVPLVDRDQQGRLGLTCPTCRQVTPIPDRGVVGLQSAFHINRFLEIKESLEKPANTAATPEETTPTDVNLVKKPRYCFVHEGKELGLYCETCGELICLKCILKGGKHHDHDCEELDQAFEKYKVEVTSFLDPMEKQVVIVKEALGQLNARSGEISYQRAATANNIHVTFRRLQEVLNVREMDLIDQLDQVTQDKLKDLAVQRDQIETILAQLNSCLHFMRESLRAGNEEDVLMMKANTVGQVKELTTPFQPGAIEPKAGARIEFSASADLTAVCQKYGQVFAPGSPDPSQCHVTGKVAEVVAVGEKCTAILQAVDFEGKLCKESIKSLECNYLSDITHTKASCSVRGSGQNRYKISYQPTIRGRHQLHIKVQGQHIKGSPFSVAVKSPVEKLGTPILTIIGGVCNPWGVAVNQRGEVLVAECGGHCISMFSPSGGKLDFLGTQGSGPGQFQAPRDVAMDGEGNILVADSGNHRIQRFTSEGQFLTSVGTKGSGRLQFSLPTGIAFNASNNKVYVADMDNHCIQVLNSNLTFSSTIGKEGSGRRQFFCPHGVACDSTGKVYVADCSNHRIQVFTADGRFLRMLGRHGQGRGELNEPVGIAVDTSGMVYVSEDHNHRISVFTSEGQFVTSFGKWGKGPGEFVCLRGLAVDSSGVVYVCDGYNNRVQLL